MSKKIKLPRKRKKAFIKKNGSLDYMAAQVVNEIMREDRPFDKKGTKFPELKMQGRKLITLFYW